jgi:predicted nuclease of predicted toxin-antitoxin system
MTFLLDVNLSPAWIPKLEAAGLGVTDWRSVGELGAPDAALFDYARERGMTIITHDLDFSAVLALTHATGPSVVQLRTLNPDPEIHAGMVLSSIQRFSEYLEAGAILSISEESVRVRTLPIR